MKKFYKILLAGLILSLLPNNIINAENTTEELINIATEAAYTVEPSYAPKSAILVNADTGEILWENNIDKVRDPASITKLMTIYLVLEAINNGEFTLDTKIIATENDEKISNLQNLSNRRVYAGVEYPV